jgi:hypothetical protein
VSLWQAFILVVLLPWLVSLMAPNLLAGHPLGFIHGLGGDIPLAALRVGTLTALVYLSRNSVLRARELQADVRAASWDTSTAELIRLAAQQPSARRWRHWLRVHPAPSERLSAIGDPARLLRPSFGTLALTTLGAAALAQAANGVLVFALSAVKVDILPASQDGIPVAIMIAVPVALILAVTALRSRDYIRLGGKRAGTYSAALVAVLAGLLLGPLADLFDLQGVLGGGVLADPTVPAITYVLVQALLIVGAFAVLCQMRGQRARAALAPPTRGKGRSLMAATAIALSLALAASSELSVTAFRFVPAGEASTDAFEMRVWDAYGGRHQIVAVSGELTSVIADFGALDTSKLGTDCAALQAAASRAERFPALPDQEAEVQWLTLLGNFTSIAQYCQSPDTDVHEAVNGEVLNGVFALMSLVARIDSFEAGPG